MRSPHPDRVRVLLPASTPLSYAVAAPMLRALAAHPAVRVAVTARHGGEALARECLDVPFDWVPRLLAPLRRYELALCPGFYFESRRAAASVQVFHGVSPKNYAVSDAALRYGTWFLIGPYHRRKFERAGLLKDGDPRALDVGMPKTDPLLAPHPDRRAALAELQLDAARPTLAYCPTRSGANGSSIDRDGLAALDSLAPLPLNVIVKLHDRSQRRFRAKLERDLEGELLERERRGALRVWRGHDVIPLLRLADVLLSDLSSVSNEFLLRDRPVIHLAVPAHETKIEESRRRRFGGDDPHDLAWLRAAGETIEQASALPAAVDRALADPTARSAERRERAAELFYNPGRATAAARDALFALLGLEARAAQAAAR